MDEQNEMHTLWDKYSGTHLNFILLERITHLEAIIAELKAALFNIEMTNVARFWSNEILDVNPEKAFIQGTRYAFKQTAYIAEKALAMVKDMENK